MKQDKEYYVEMVLGYETDTYDREGQISRAYYGENYRTCKRYTGNGGKGENFGGDRASSSHVLCNKDERRKTL